MRQVENDVYCSYANRANFEAKYAPVPDNTNITGLTGASDFRPAFLAAQCASVSIGNPYQPLISAPF